MTREEFWKYCEGRFVYLDGATGSNLQKRGMPSGVCPEQWILEHPKELVGLQKEFVSAGSNILYAPTFTANRIKLAEYGLDGEIERINRELVALSRQAGGEGVLVAGDITMTGRQLKPVGDLDLEELISIYKEQISILKEAGVDLIVVETMLSLQETRAALIAAKEASDLAVMATLTFEADGRTLFGTDPQTAMIVLQSLGAAAVGVNCSTGPDKMVEIVGQMHQVARIPIIAKPNAGLPMLDKEGNTYYGMDAPTFGAQMLALAESGATILGGCCGTTPEHIRALVSTIEDSSANISKKSDFSVEGIVGGNNTVEFSASSESITNGNSMTALSGSSLSAKEEEIDKESNGAELGREAMQGNNKQGSCRYLASERQTLCFGLDDPFILIGERINPTGKKKFQASIRKGDLSMVDEFVVQQEECGAKVLDINMGMSGIDEKEMMLEVITEVTSQTSLPLCIDSSHIEVQEAALRAYPGRALINSISLEKEKFEKLLPLAKKYGAMFILLPLSDKGLPESLAEKKEIIHTILNRAIELGMDKEDIIVDGLVATVGANKNAALEVLETIRYCKSIGLATVCGLSNISFGLPQRSFINAFFLTMAIANGLTMAIANPNQDLLTTCMYASDLLLNKPEADLNYIEAMERLEEKESSLVCAPKNTGTAGNPSPAVVKQEKNTGKESAGNAATDKKDGAVQKEGSAAQKGSPDAAGKNDRNGQAQASTLAEEDSPLGQVYKAVLKGNRRQIENHVKEALEGGLSADKILNEALLPAIQEVGALFDKGKYFLPQLIASAESMKLGIGVIEPILKQQSDGRFLGTIVIATVQGDIHDIGKNLVALMLGNFGFKVIDLGKDVPKETIVETAMREKADIIALSALMTTTMQQMKAVIAYAKEKGCTAKIMVGGAVITQDYADEIGADAYSTDASDAVHAAKKVLALE